jgi:hypothetical protein
MMCKVHAISNSLFYLTKCYKRCLDGWRHVSKIYKHIMSHAHDQKSTYPNLIRLTTYVKQPRLHDLS